MLSRRTKKSALLKMLLAGAASAALALTGAVSAAAEDAPTATITGQVTREDGGVPVENVGVFVTPTAGGFSYNGYTDATGAYSVVGLPAGEYTVRFAPDAAGGGLLSEFWDDAPDWFAAKKLTLSGGETVADIDAALEVGGAVSGRVTRADDGSPVAGAPVNVMKADNLGFGGMRWTGPDGTFLIDGLRPGDYVVQYSAPMGSTLAGEYWEDAVHALDSTLVSVTPGQTTADIDAELAESASISGHVSRADGSALTGTVTVSGAHGPVAIVPIESDGGYQAQVSAGSYILHFEADGASVVSEYWNDAALESDATPVVVTPGQHLDGVDAELALNGYTSIRGSVSSGGEPVTEGLVEAWADGLIVGMSYVDDAGEYELTLPPGTYQLLAWGNEYDPIYARQYYLDAKTASEATAVALGSDSDVLGIDFELSIGGDIQGSVTATGELPAEGAEVTAYLFSGGEWRIAAVAMADGEYRFGYGMPAPASFGGPLPAGSYKIGVEADGYCETFNGGAGSLEDAEPIEMNEGQVLAGIDVTLTTDCAAPKPRISVAAGSVSAGGEIAVTGKNFAPGETVAFELHSDPIALGSLVADSDGRLSGSLRIPATAPAGSHTLVAVGAQSAIEASVALQVTAATGAGTGSGSATTPPVRGAAATGLASTGAELPGGILIAGLFLALCGGVLLRRRATKA